VSYKDRETRNRYQLEWIKRRRLAWITENGPCEECGSQEDLEVDHRDPGQKLLQPAVLWSMSPHNRKRIDELLKCRVLCKECHTEKTNLELQETRQGELNWNTNLTEEDVRDIRRLRGEGLTYTQIAVQFQLSKSGVANICKFARWTHVI
jgi:5-methylcytosine-specific restriction endonuclease McrA